MSAQQEHYIAVFDSGVGGVSVLRHLRELLPQERFLYYGDCANAPYGLRSTAQVRQLTLEAVAQIQQLRPIKALVVACNTATSAAIAQLRSLYPELIVIGIEPALKLAADRFPGGHIGVMATQVTLREEKFDLLLQRWGSQCQVEKISAPGLVELVEQGKEQDADAQLLLEPILAPYRGKLDALVLGCTHYPFASAAIQKILGSNTVLLDGGAGTARETRNRLERAQLLTAPGKGCVEFYTSGDSQHFEVLAQRLLDRQEDNYGL